jgi:hypothetical protein
VVDTNIREMTALREHVAKTIGWYRAVADAVSETKLQILDNVQFAREWITAIENASDMTEQERADAINAVIRATHALNVAAVAGGAAKVQPLTAFQAPPIPSQPLSPPPLTPSSEQTTPKPAYVRAPPPPPELDIRGGGTPSPVFSPSHNPPAHPLPAVGAPAEPAAPIAAAPSMSSPGGGTPSSGVTTSSPGGGLSASPASGTSTSSTSGTGTPTTANPAATTGQPTNPAATGAAAAKAAPAQPVMPQLPLGPPTAATPPAPAPAPTPAAPPAAPPTAAGISTSSGTGGGGFSGSGGGAAGPVGAGPGASPPTPPVPLGPPTTPPPAAPPPPGAAPAGPIGPGVMPASTSNTSPAAAPAPVPVSAARAERDAIATAATAGALRRQAGGNDPLQLARRIGAALNVGVIDFGFFWVTGITNDSRIVVANSYGLAYIPDGVSLPDRVHMATADESIPVAERAKWATYPILAVQGWAQHHNTSLRAVVATEAQFAEFDPGVAKIVLQPDDIPDSGKMQGRSRLDVISPEAATRLAAVSDVGLTEVLPPAFADVNPPADETHLLWFEVAKPLMSTSTARGAAHLEAFRTYANHAQELALYRAHTATDAVTQRAAIADWVYWQHLSVLVSDAVSSSASV